MESPCPQGLRMGKAYDSPAICALAESSGSIPRIRRAAGKRKRSRRSRVLLPRLTRDHEKNPRHHEAFVYLAFIGVMARRLTTGANPPPPPAPKPQPSLLEWIRRRQRLSA